MGSKSSKAKRKKGGAKGDTAGSTRSGARAPPSASSAVPVAIETQSDSASNPKPRTTTLLDDLPSLVQDAAAAAGGSSAVPDERYFNLSLFGGLAFRFCCAVLLAEHLEADSEAMVDCRASLQELLSESEYLEEAPLLDWATPDRKHETLQVGKRLRTMVQQQCQRSVDSVATEPARPAAMRGLIKSPGHLALVQTVQRLLSEMMSLYASTERLRPDEVSLVVDRLHEQRDDLVLAAMRDATDRRDASDNLSAITIQLVRLMIVYALPVRCSNGLYQLTDHLQRLCRAARALETAIVDKNLGQTDAMVQQVVGVMDRSSSSLLTCVQAMRPDAQQLRWDEAAYALVEERISSVISRVNSTNSGIFSDETKMNTFHVWPNRHIQSLSNAITAIKGSIRRPDPFTVLSAGMTIQSSIFDLCSPIPTLISPLSSTGRYQLCVLCGQSLLHYAFLTQIVVGMKESAFSIVEYSSALYGVLFGMAHTLEVMMATLQAMNPTWEPILMKMINENKRGGGGVGDGSSCSMNLISDQLAEIGSRHLLTFARPSAKEIDSSVLLLDDNAEILQEERRRRYVQEMMKREKEEKQRDLDTVGEIDGLIDDIANLGEHSETILNRENTKRKETSTNLIVEEEMKRYESYEDRMARKAAMERNKREKEQKEKQVEIEKEKHLSAAESDKIRAEGPPPKKPVLPENASRDEYKEYMIEKLAYEEWENACIRHERRTKGLM